MMSEQRLIENTPVTYLSFDYLKRLFGCSGRFELPSTTIWLWTMRQKQVMIRTLSLDERVNLTECGEEQLGDVGGSRRINRTSVIIIHKRLPAVDRSPEKN